MAPFKKNLTPLSKGGQVIKHKGKGSQVTDLPDRRQITGLATPAGNSINDYAKVTPLANPGLGPNNDPFIP
jgi:hypothetical protein